jgi:hypothetical protein
MREGIAALEPIRHGFVAALAGILSKFGPPVLRKIILGLADV